MKSIEVKIKLLILFVLLYIILLCIENFKLTKPIANEYLESNLNPEFETNLQIILEPSGLCNFKSKFIFIYVFTAVKSFARRQLIRDTWANKSLNLFNFDLVFIIGKKNNQSNETMDTQIKQEQLKYNDLIQGNFIDAYRNLSYKSLIAWKWIKHNCNQASYVIKLDDDVLLNTYKIKRILNNYDIFKSINNSFICTVYPKSYPIRDPQSPYSKWYVTQIEYNFDLYKNLSISDDGYPTYCWGTGIVMTTDLISKLYLKAYEIKFFWIDDVYVGILGKYINAQFENIGSLYSSDLNRLNDVIFINGADTLDDVNKIWNLIDRN